MAFRGESILPKSLRNLLMGDTSLATPIKAVRDLKIQAASKFSERWDAMHETVHQFLEHGPLNTAVSNMRSPFGVMSAPFRGRQWFDMWWRTGASVGYGGLIGFNTFLITLYATGLASSITKLHDKDNIIPISLSYYPGIDPNKTLGYVPDIIRDAFINNRFDTPLGYTMLLASMLVAHFYVQDKFLIPWRSLITSNQNRNSARWMLDQFTKAVFDTKGTLHKLLTIRDEKDEKQAKFIDFDQRVTVPTRNVLGNFIGIMQGMPERAATMAFMGAALVHNSAPIKGLDSLGEYATLGLGAALGVPFVLGGSIYAYMKGRSLLDINALRQKHDGVYRSFLSQTVRSGFHIAASQGTSLYKKMSDQLYQKADEAWERDLTLDIRYTGFKKNYDAFMHHILAAAPALPAYISGDITLQQYLLFSAALDAVMGQLSLVVPMVPSVANLLADCRRLTEAANAIEDVQDAEKFFGERGIYAFQHHHDSVGDVCIRNLQLMHEGQTTPFLQAARDITLQAGKWYYIKGVNGCGKTTFLNALNGQHYYGRGEFYLPPKEQIMYLTQSMPEEAMSLRQLITYPHEESAYRVEQKARDAAAACMIRVGLSEHVKDIDAIKTLSGGERQKLMIARARFHQPRFLCLDETFAASDPQAKRHLLGVLKKSCPNTTVVAVMHEDSMPLDRSGNPFFDEVLAIEDGWMHQYPVERAARHVPPAKMAPSVVLINNQGFSPSVLQGPSIL